VTPAGQAVLHPPLLHELGHRHVQSFGEPLDIEERNISLAPFHAADVGPVQPRFGRELLLRNAHPFADCSQVTPEPDQYVAQRRRSRKKPPMSPGIDGSFEKCILNGYRLYVSVS
jgi:hypothetical protein